MRKLAVFLVMAAYAVLLFSLFSFQASSINSYSNTTVSSDSKTQQYPSYLGLSGAEYHPEKSLYGKIVAFFNKDEASIYQNQTNSSSIWVDIRALFSKS